MVAVAWRGVEGWKSARRRACWVDTVLMGPLLGKARKVAMEEEGRELRRSATDEEGIKRTTRGGALVLGGVIRGLDVQVGEHQG
jgi:hypothetical protein